MDPQPSLAMSFPTLDEAESALDWIGVDFVESGNAFEGHLVDDDRELLDEVIGDPDAPSPVQDLAAALRQLLDASPSGAEVPWRVTFEG